VFATARQPERATDLQALEEKYPERLHLVKMICADVESNQAVAKEIEEKKYGRVDVVIANAGKLATLVQNWPHAHVDHPGLGNHMGPASDTPPEVMSEHFEVC
jgi:NADP-dependent 3-hydroxy acid dehydrogenase YdfG